VFRAIPIIVSAILLSRPTMPLPEARRYARVLAEEARKHDFDPLTAVAIVHFESRWIPSVVSADGEDYGLGQIRARWLGACRDDADPVNDPSPACRAAKVGLLAGENNLRRMATIISANRDLCKEKTGRGDLPRWLAGYEGLNRPSLDVWCAPSAKTWQVVEYRKQLVAQLVTKARRAPKPKTPPQTPADSARYAALRESRAVTAQRAPASVRARP
jgi:hypothetical protein